MSAERWISVFCLSISTIACADPAGPVALPGEILAAGRGPLEWSLDGGHIYYSGDSTHAGQIYSVDVVSGVSRRVVNCAFPPVETTAGLAYLDCTSPSALHLLNAGHDSIMSSAVFWLTRSEDRTRLIYLGEDVEGAGGDTLHVVDFARGTHHVLTTVQFGTTLGGYVAPSGTEMIVQFADYKFGIVNLENGALRRLDDSLLSFYIPPRAVGWNDAGVWVLGGGLGLYDPATGTWRSGGAAGVGGRAATVERPGRRAATWAADCMGEDSAGCVRGLFTLYVLDPLRNAAPFEILKFQTEDVLRYWRGIEGVAFSPDGRSIAYTFGNELRLVTLSTER